MLFDIMKYSNWTPDEDALKKPLAAPLIKQTETTLFEMRRQQAGEGRLCECLPFCQIIRRNVL